jgi:hypothetical protein
VSDSNSRAHRLDNQPARLLCGELVVAVQSIRVRHANSHWGWYNLVSYRFVNRVGGGNMPAGRFNALPLAR